MGKKGMSFLLGAGRLFFLLVEVTNVTVQEGQGAGNKGSTFFIFR
jgi:hypothetical protein